MDSDSRAVLMAGPVAAQSVPTATQPVVFIEHGVLSEALEHKRDALLHTQKDLAIEGNFRNKPGAVEFHDTVTDVFLVTDGEATFVAGGKQVGGARAAPDQVRGGTIEGGTTYHLVKGDVIIIPAATPHWFKEVPKTISYYAVKVFQK